MLCSAWVSGVSAESLVLATVLLVLCTLVVQDIYSRNRRKSCEIGFSAGHLRVHRRLGMFFLCMENAEKDVQCTLCISTLCPMWRGSIKSQLRDLILNFSFPGIQMKSAYQLFCVMFSTYIQVYIERPCLFTLKVSQVKPKFLLTEMTHILISHLGKLSEISAGNSSYLPLQQSFSMGT